MSTKLGNILVVLLEAFLFSFSYSFSWIVRTEVIFFISYFEKVKQRRRQFLKVKYVGNVELAFLELEIGSFSENFKSQV